MKTLFVIAFVSYSVSSLAQYKIPDSLFFNYRCFGIGGLIENPLTLNISFDDWHQKTSINTSIILDYGNKIIFNLKKGNKVFEITSLPCDLVTNDGLKVKGFNAENDNKKYKFYFIENGDLWMKEENDKRIIKYSGLVE